MQNHEDRKLARRLRDAAPSAPAPDFDAMWRRAEAVAHAANDDADAPRAPRRPAPLMIAALAASLLAAALWWQRGAPERDVVPAPRSSATVAEVSAPPAEQPALDALEPQLDGAWAAPTDFLLAESDVWEVDEDWDAIWDEPLDEPL